MVNIYYGAWGDTGTHWPQGSGEKMHAKFMESH